MQLIKFLVFLVVLAGVAGVGIVIAAPSNPQANMLKEKLHLAPLQPLATETQTTLSQVQTKFPQLGSVLGMKTEELKNSPHASLPQKTAEYARYAYCQQVVQDYEGRMGIHSEEKAAESATPSSSSVKQ